MTFSDGFGLQCYFGHELSPNKYLANLKSLVDLLLYFSSPLLSREKYDVNFSTSLSSSLVAAATTLKTGLLDRYNLNWIWPKLSIVSPFAEYNSENSYSTVAALPAPLDEDFESFQIVPSRPSPTTNEFFRSPPYMEGVKDDTGSLSDNELGVIASFLRAVATNGHLWSDFLAMAHIY